jgi:hypothetical protein
MPSEVRSAELAADAAEAGMGGWKMERLRSKDATAVTRPSPDLPVMVIAVMVVMVMPAVAAIDADDRGRLDVHH